MIETHRTNAGMAVTALAELPQMLLVLSQRLDRAKEVHERHERLNEAVPFVVLSEETSEDPLARWEQEAEAAQLQARVDAARSEIATTALGVLNRWNVTHAQSPDPVFVETISHKEASALSAWATYYYQALRVGEFDKAGVEVQYGQSCGVNQFLAELNGPAPTDPENIDMQPATALFAMFSIAMIRPTDADPLM